MSFNLTWSRRWRLHETAPPRRRRRGRMRLYAPRERNEASFRDGVVPTQDKAIDDDEKRVRLHRKYEAERLSQQAPKKPPKHCYLPAPIPDGKKPQDDLKYVYLSQDEDGNECKATWHSRTVEIDYGEFQCIELQAPFNLGSLAVGVRCCSLCAVECISRRSCPSLGRNQGRGAEIARP